MEFLQKTNTDFGAVRDGRRAMPLYIDIDLSTARSIAAGNALVLNIAGNTVFSNPNPACGDCVLHFQDTTLGAASAPFYVTPGFIANVEFTQILVENAAQTGRIARIFYGVDLDFQAGSNTNVNIAGSVDSKITVGDLSNSISGAYTGGVALITAAANTTGVIVTSATLRVNTSLANLMLGEPFMLVGVTGSRVVSKVSAVVINGANAMITVDTPNSLYIPAGQALYCWGCQATDTNYNGRACWRNA